MKVISEHEEWRLLIMVCPLFESNLCWTSTDSSHVSQVVVEDTAELLKCQIQLIKVVPAGECLSEDAQEDFVHKILALLSSLETLLNDAIKNEECLQPGADINTIGLERYTASLCHRCPRLVALDHLLRNSSEQNIIAQMSRFVNLRQDACAFKRTRIDVERFNHAMDSLLGSHRSEGRARVARTAPTQCRSKISDPYCSQSRRLFESLASHLQNCTTSNFKHCAMLQLKHIEHQEDQDDLEERAAQPVFCIRFGSCTEHGNWIPTHCTVSTSVNIGNEDEWAVPVSRICESAGYASQNRHIFSLKLTEGQFFDISGDIDISDNRFMSMDLGTVPMVSLHKLLRSNILRDRYRFFPNDKKILAYTLAHALLNLHDNPWLQSLWTTDKIFFLQSYETGMLYNVHQPYVSCFLSTDAPPLETLDPLHNYPVVFSFAKLLWELETGEELLARKVNKTGQPSLWVTLRDFCLNESKHQFSRGYRNALKACVNFPGCVNREKALTRDSKAAEKQAILKNIVHELESEIDFTLMKEWGTRDLDLKLRMVVTGQHIHVDTIQHRLEAPKRATAWSASIEEGLGSIWTSSPPMTRKRSPDHFEQYQGRKSARITATQRKTKARLIPVTSEEKSAFCAQGFKNGTNLGFGYMELFSASEFGPEISSESFSYLHDVVDEHWQHWDTDKPIRVAVLDTGFDWTHDDFQLARTKRFTGEYQNIAQPEPREKKQTERVVAWRNFCPDQTGDDVSDVDGHGTQVAGILLRLAPNIQLYVARVCTGQRTRGLSEDQRQQLEEEEHQRPEPDVLEQAIQWAIDNQVHIINISLGFRKAETNCIDKLRERLHQVQNNRQAIVFAATSNQGAHEPVAWPARSLRCAIGVHSCGDTGREPSNFSAYPTRTHDAANFMVVGEKILSQWPTTKGGGFRIATGTSFATPVASAIGALILQFVQQKICTQYRKSVEKRVFLNDLYTNHGMAKVLKAISTQHSDGYDIVKAKLFWWDLLPGHNGMEHAWQTIERALAN